MMTRRKRRRSNTPNLHSPESLISSIFVILSKAKDLLFLSTTQSPSNTQEIPKHRRLPLCHPQLLSKTTTSGGWPRESGLTETHISKSRCGAPSHSGGWPRTE